MSIFSKKRIIAIILFLAMILTNVAASAGTVTVHVSVDQDAAESILTGNSIPEEQLSVIEPILSLINLLNVQVVTVEDGGQINLNLNQDNALSLSFATDEQTIRLASTLFPNYLLTINQDTLTGMMATFMSNMPGATANESGEGSMSIMPTSLPTYITSFMQVCTEAAVPGEPVKGEYQFDGYNFDTLVPVTVDVPKIKEAFRGLKEDLLKDEAVLASLQGLPQVGGEELTPENLRAAMDEFETHFPDEVTAEYYQNGDDSIPFYVTGRAVCTGKEEPSYEYSMLRKDEKNYTMSFLDHEHSIVAGLILTDGGIRLEYKQGETNLVIDFMSETGEPAVYRCDLYFNDTNKPLISVSVTVATEGDRTLSLETDGKTVLTLEEIMGGESEAASGLLMDIMMNGFGPLMAKLSEVSPEAANMITTLMMPKQDPENTGGSEKETEPLVEADPSSWKTLADVLSLRTESKESSWDENNYTLIFKYAGTEWLVNAAFSKELNDAIQAVDFMAEDRDDQINSILGPCGITTVIDLKTLAMPQDELDQWIGKTGQDLLDAGWKYNGYHSDETGIHICMVNGEFQYQISFAEELAMTQVFGEQPENMVSSTVTGIVFDGKSYNFNKGDYITQPETEQKVGTNVYQLGTSVYTIRIPDSFTEGNRTEADIRDDMVAYMRSDETLLDFDVYQFTKEGRPDSLAAYAEQEAAEYNAFEVVTGKNINGIDVAWYRAKETYDGKEYTTLNYLFEDGDQYVEIAFWLDGETAEAEAQEIISTLAFIHR